LIQQKFEELKQSGALPTPSGVGLVVLRRTQDENCSLEEIAQCIQVDPALSGRLLKLANSAAWQGAQPVTTVQQAAARLGLRNVRGVALGFALVSGNRTGACAHFDYDRYWSYSLATAVAAQILASEQGTIDPMEAFTCALLSRIGMLALATVHPEPYATILSTSRSRASAELLELEVAKFQIHHWEVSASMMRDWGLPELHTSAVLLLGSDASEPGTEDPLVTALTHVLREASVVAESLLGSIAQREWALGVDWIDLLAPAAASTSDRELLRPIEAHARPVWEQWGAMFRMPTTASEALPRPSATKPATGTAAALPAPTPSESTTAPVTTLLPELPEESASLQPPEIKILAIDDDPRILRLLSHHLRQAGYQVLTADNGEQGLRLVLEESPHIVLTDWIMPEMTGIDLCRALRRTDNGRKTYVLMLTAREDEQQVVDAFAAGADDFVTKPFNARILLARVQAGQRMIDLQRQVELDKKMRMRQVAEMGLLTRKLRAAALTDVLTDLPNRRYALTRLEQEWSESVRSNRPLSVVMIDIDHFKKINDTYGHDVGDAVLKETAAILRARTRRGDVVCRLGGEEFLVINVNSDISGAVLCAERLRTSVAQNHIVCPGFDGSVTISLGCAQRVTGVRDIDDLLKAADEAVYESKASGRNTIRQARVRLPESA